MGFGGVQNSGIGAYHGKVGFDAFTHYKSTMKKSTLIETGIRNPPFNETDAPAEAGHARGNRPSRSTPPRRTGLTLVSPSKRSNRGEPNEPTSPLTQQARGSIPTREA